MKDKIVALIGKGLMIGTIAAPVAGLLYAKEITDLPAYIVVAYMTIGSMVYSALGRS